jgi:aryl-alcohol dehydrogenase-like predicted oxidoreductase
MKKVIIAGTMSVSQLAFGTACLHHHPTTGTRQKILAAAADLGFTHFDTSPYYGFGIAEAELGRFLRETHKEITVASKVGLYPPGGRSSSAFSIWARKTGGKFFHSVSRPIKDWSLSTAESSLNQTLRTLGRDSVDVLFLHEPVAGLLDVTEFLEWLDRQMQLGKIRSWGLAGPLNRFRSLLGHPLARVIQVPDKDVLMLASSGYQPQFSYSALSSISCTNRPLKGAEAISAALVRNRRGAVIVSSRKAGHLRELVEAADSLCLS